MDEKEDKDLIKFLVDMGILKDLGYNEELGENLYYIDSKADEIFPQLKQEQMKSLNQSVFDLWELEMLDVTFDENGEPLIGLNKNSLDKQKIAAIEDEELRRQHIMIVTIFDEYFNR